MIFKSKKFSWSFLWVLLLFFSSCVQNQNSNSSDDVTFGNPGITTSTKFYKAYKVIQAKCLPCHSQWKDFKTSQQWIDEGLIVSGSTSGSSIYTALTYFGGSMPKDPYEPLTETEVKSVKDWILSPD